MLPKQATIPTTMNGAGLSGNEGAKGWRRCHTPAPTNAPITIPGPKIPPEAPEPTDREVARILTKGRARMTHRARSELGPVIAFCTKP